VELSSLVNNLFPLPLSRAYAPALVFYFFFIIMAGAWGKD